MVRRASVVAGILAAMSAAGAGAQMEGISEMLARRAEASPEAPAEAAARSRGPLPPGELLFSMTGADNASCVRSVADVNGDGREEVLVGIDESGVDNVFLLDGASSGTATVLWAIETMDGVSGGSPYGDLSLEPVSDTDGNGFQNLLLGTAWGGRTAYNLDAMDGSTVWKLDTYLQPDSGWVYSLVELADMTGDGVPEAAFGVGSDNDRVYAVDGSGAGGPATVLWSYQAADAVLAVANVGDVSGDGDDDVLAAVGDLGDALVCLSGGTPLPQGQVLWSYPAGGSVFATESMPDITGDGRREALAGIWTTGGDAVRALDGATGAVVWSSTTVGQFVMLLDLLADVTGDGVPEVVVSSWENAVIVLDGMSGAQVWKTTVGTLNGGDVWTARATPDLDGDGLEDVAAGSFDTFVYALSGADGTILWAYETGNRVFSVHPVGDLDGDGVAEVAAGTQDTTSNTVVYVLSGGFGQTLFADGFESGDTAAWSSTSP